MAQVRGIEDLPLDELREILIRVAKQPNGALDITRAFAVSKTFLNFIEDKDVLCAVSFKDMPPLIAQQYELLMEVQGLTVRCARAGNSSARSALGKVVLVSSSKICTTYVESCWRPVSYGNNNLDILDKAARLLNCFSAQNKNPTELIDLVRNFLSQATVGDLDEVRYCHLGTFFALYLTPEKKPLLPQFTSAVEGLCQKYSVPLALSSDPHAYLVRHFNMLCNMGYKMMKGIGIDEKAIYSLIACSVHDDEADDVGCEALLERLDIIDPILKLGGEMVSNDIDNYELLLANGGISCLSKTLRRQMVQLMEHEAFVKSARGLILSSFDALFDIQQG